MISERIFTVFGRRAPSTSLFELSVRLLEAQKSSWPQLSAGYASLAAVKTRELCCGPYTVHLQFNPARIVSTGANVDPGSIRNRRCFLCEANLPKEQKGILYNGRYLVLCNPAPIFNRHFTISHVDHVPQAIEPHFDTMLDLARDLRVGATVFYNGPQCGASAPDHMHFQASPAGAIPVETDVQNPDFRENVGMRNGVSVARLRRYGREAIVFESGGKDELQRLIGRVIAALKSVTGETEEPKMNMLCSFAGEAWRVILFPRDKHRPDAYFRPGEEQILISPAAVDIGGLVIAPVERDFERVDATTVQAIFAEVTLGSEKVDRVVELALNRQH